MKSANRDPRQRKVGEVSKQTMRERCVNGPPEIVAAEQFKMTPTQSDYFMFDFNELERRSPITVEDKHHDVHRPVHERDYRGEDALERFRLAEKRIVQETVMSIDGNDVDNDDECPYLDSRFSDTEGEKSTNAPFRPGCRADKA